MTRRRAAAILCPGPSLRDFWSEAVWPGYDFTIAVNRAAWLIGHEYDWLASYDHCNLVGVEEREALPRVGVFTLPKHVQAAQIRDERWQALEFRDSDETIERWGRGRRSYTAVGALLLAADLGAEAIDVFGADMAGAHYVDGAEIGNPPGVRWDVRERPEWERTAGQLRDRGILVERILPSTTTAEVQEFTEKPVTFADLTIDEKRRWRAARGLGATRGLIDPQELRAVLAEDD